MEASENTGVPGQRGCGPGLHRIDPDRVAGTLSSGGNHEGFARLHLMVSTILDRLVTVEHAGGGR